MKKSKCISLYYNIFKNTLFLTNALLLEKYVMREKQSLEQVVKINPAPNQSQDITVRR